MKKLLIILIFVLGCEKEYEANISETWIHIYSDLPQENGVYIFEYPENSSNSYFKIHYDSYPLQRVFWYSPNQWYTIMFNDTIWSPSIQYSTYGRDGDGTGLQNFYISHQFIGDTLELYGYLNKDIVEMVRVFVK